MGSRLEKNERIQLEKLAEVLPPRTKITVKDLENPTAVLACTADVDDTNLSERILSNIAANESKIESEREGSVPLALRRAQQEIRTEARVSKKRTKITDGFDAAK
eukprot:IDg10422t1